MFKFICLSFAYVNKNTFSIWLVLGDPHSGGGGSTDPYKTLFVARVVSYFMDHL